MRLSGFDYSRPMFYMVTLKCLPGRQALSAIVDPGRCEMNLTTRAFVNCIRTFHMGCEGRMLFLSLYEPQAAKLDNPTLYRRCHEMGDLAVAAVRAKLLGEAPPSPVP